MMINEMVRLKESEAQLKLAIQEVPPDPTIASFAKPQENPSEAFDRTMKKALSVSKQELQ